MNKAQLAKKLYDYLNQNKIGNLTRDLQYQPRIATYKVTAEEILDFILKTLQEAILTGEKVNIPEIGIFRVVKKNARNARNPKTGEQVPYVQYNDKTQQLLSDVFADLETQLNSLANG